MQQITTFEIAGSPRERGRQYGAGLKDLIHARDAAWRRSLEAQTGRPSEDVIDDFLRTTHFAGAIERFTPGLLEEVKGIAEGSGLGFEPIYAAQLMDEEWWLIAGEKAGHHCSSFGVAGAGGRPALAAQNMDLVDWNEGFQVLLTIRGEAGAPDQMVLTMAGMIGLCGLTSAGLGLVVNTLSQLSVRRDGLPVAFVSRGALAAGSHDGAVAFLNRVTHASGQNYIVVGREALSDLECSAAGAVPFARRTDCVWHTNHPLASRDLRGGSHDHVASERNSQSRMAVLDRELGSGLMPDVSTAKRLLANRDDAAEPVSRRLGENGSHAYTFASVVYELGPEPRVHVAAGPPCSTPFKSYGFERAKRMAAE
ncbi:MAG: C45 family peptidase [Hyphomicrobiaceae bacterium]